MQRYVTVSAKIPSKLRQKMRRLGIRPSRAFRIGLEEELNRKQALGLVKKAQRLKKVLERIPIEEVVEGIREDRSR
jgi:hypothetical protein